jgi:hypothetical protein
MTALSRILAALMVLAVLVLAGGSVAAHVVGVPGARAVDAMAIGAALLVVLVAAAVAVSVRLFSGVDRCSSTRRRRGDGT